MITRVTLTWCQWNFVSVLSILAAANRWSLEWPWPSNVELFKCPKHLGSSRPMIYSMTLTSLISLAAAEGWSLVWAWPYLDPSDEELSQCPKHFGSSSRRMISSMGYDLDLTLTPLIRNSLSVLSILAAADRWCLVWPWPYLDPSDAELSQCPKHLCSSRRMVSSMGYDLDLTLTPLMRNSLSVLSILAAADGWSLAWAMTLTLPWPLWCGTL